MTYVVLVADKVADAGLQVLQQCVEFEVVVAAGDREKFRTELPRAHGLLVRSDTRVSAEVIEVADNLRVIGRAGIGVDNIDLAAATHRGIPVLNAPSANTISAAEHTMALLLGLVRRIPWAVDSMRRGEWDRKAFSGIELRGKTMGILGLGRIGRHVAGIARAFGMNVVAHDPFLSEQRAKSLDVVLVSLDDVLRAADVVTLHLPLTDKTRNAIDREQLALMKPGAMLINTARGGLVNEEALVEALADGTIYGAAVDVFSEEPLPAASPLRQSERLILTPHLAASTVEAQERVGVEICTAIRDVLLTGDIGGAVNVAGVSSVVMAHLRPLLELARRIGRLCATISGGRVEAIEVQYGGSDEDAPRPVELAAVEGALGAMGVGRVTLVNAMPVATDRGIALSRRVGGPLAGFETTLSVTVRTADRTTTVTGALVGDRIRVGRIIRIDGFVVDVPAEGSILVLWNRDVPGVIGKVGTILGEAATNIASYHQSRRAGDSGPGALAAIIVDQPPDLEVIGRLQALPDVLKVWVADLNGSPER